MQHRELKLVNLKDSGKQKIKLNSKLEIQISHRFREFE
jgi:hypothetical protein